ncbi:restriction endonuclease subunit S [Celeribacter halophilus]|uniref:restriction endonuclease subunit S n=1 Tax=Celeribacter halophilus TaxID=576117 RepID=UPI0026E23415|nr:restriction endonuclease subunit S [Celeribacter halophilus]MDO6722428.1 restriction endonuclease subunit S [Celeribacter halophilus]
MTDVNQLITEHLDIWTSAIEKKSSAGRGNGGAVTLYGIKRLRALVLELAVRGKLVPQVVDDGTTNSYLDEVIRVRNELVKHGKAKKLKKLPAILESEVPFETPNGWSWVRLQDISGYIQRGKSPKYADSGRVQVISQKCVQWGFFDLEKARYISDDSIEGYGPERFLRSGDVLWNSTGTGTVGRVLSVEIEEEQALVADSHVTVVRSISGCPKFLEVYLSSAGIQDRIDPAHERSLVSGSTKQVELNTSTVNALPIPLPPLEEQHRIVAKVDELMGLCDALERQAEDSLKAHQTLVDTCLATLTNSQTPEDLTQNWIRIEAHFDTLFTTEESAAALRNAILEMAAMGLLTRRASSQVTPDEILKRIAKDKKGLVDRGELRREKPLEKLDPKKVPFALPSGWAWAKIGDIALFTQYGTSQKAAKLPEGVPVLAMGNIQGGAVSLESEKLLPRHWEEFPSLLLQPGDLLYNRTNSAELVGKTGLFDGPEDAYTFASYLIRIRLDHSLVRPQYLNFVMNSPFFRATQIVPKIKKQTGQANVNGTFLKNMLVPLPPTEEQDSVIKQIEELSKVCGGLAKGFSQIGAFQRIIADTLTSKIH